MDGTLPPPRLDENFSVMSLAPGWSRAIFIGWCGIIAGMACTGVSSHIIGRPVFWLDDQRWSAFVLSILVLVVAGSMVACAFWISTNRPWSPIVSGSATALLTAVAIVDRHDSPGAAVVEGALAAAGLLLTLSSWAGRYRPAPVH